MKAPQQILGILLWAALLLAEQTGATVASTGRGSVQYNKQTDYGTYKFGYDTGDQGAHSFRQEHRGFDGIVHGRYGYTDANGKLRYVEYTAGPFGYRVKGDTGAQPSPVKIDEGYKVPSDPELSDLQVGLAKIKKDNLFGVPVSPYIKGYTHTTPVPSVPKVIPGDPVKSIVTVPEQPPVFVQPPVVHVPPQPALVVREDKPFVHEQPPIQQVLIKEPIGEQPKKSIFVEHSVQPGYFGGYVPPIPVKSIPQVPHPPADIQFNPQNPLLISHNNGHVFNPPTHPLTENHHVKIVHSHLPQIFEKRVTPYNKVYVQQPPPVIQHPPPVVQHPQHPSSLVIQHPHSVIQHPPTVIHPAVNHQQIFQAPVGDHFTKGYVATTPSPVIRVVPPPEVPKSIFTRVEPPPKSVYVDPPKSVHRIQPPPTVFVEQPKTIVRVEPPKTVYVHQPQKTVYVQEPQKTVVVQQPQKTVYVHEPPKTVYVKEPPKTVYIKEEPKTVFVQQPPKTVFVQQPPKTVVVQQPPKTVYVHQPPKTVYVTQQPKTVYVTQPPNIVRVESPPKTVYVPSPPKTVYVPSPPKTVYVPSPPKTVYVPSPPKTVYVPSPPKTVYVPSPPKVVHVESPKSIHVEHQPKQPCIRCRVDNQKGYFPHSISRQYIFANPVSPAVKGYTGIRTEPGRSGSYTRVQSSTGHRRGEENLVWIPAPENRFRLSDGRYHGGLPGYAYNRY